MTPEKKHTRAIVGIAVLGLTLRLIFLFTLGKGLGFGDEGEYVADATRLLEGLPLGERNWALYLRAPGYPVFIAGLWAITGVRTTFVIKAAQCVLDGLFVYFAGKTAQQLAPRLPLAGPAGAVVAAGYPFFIYHSSLVASESLFGVLLMSGVYLLTKALSSDRTSLLAAGGIVLGVANLVRPNLTMTLPLLAVWLLWKERKRLLTGARSVAVITAMVLAVSAPWILHLHSRGFGWVWITDGGSLFYYMGHNDSIHAMFCTETTPDEYRRLNGFGGAEQFMQHPDYLEAKASDRPQSVFLHRALAWDAAHLSQLPCLTAMKVWSYLRPWVNPVIYPRSMVLASLSSLLLFLLGAWGWSSIERSEFSRVWAALALIQIGVSILVAAVFSTMIRYRIPIVDALLSPLAGIALARLFLLAKQLRAKSSAFREEKGGPR